MYKSARRQQQFGLTFDNFLQYVINDRVNVLINITEQEWKTVANGHLQLLQEIAVIERGNLRLEKDEIAQSSAVVMAVLVILLQDNNTYGLTTNLLIILQSRQILAP